MTDKPADENAPEAAEDPVETPAETPAEAVAETPDAEPAAVEPAADEPAAEEPAAETAAADASDGEEPVAAAEEPAAEEPAAEEAAPVEVDSPAALAAAVQPLRSISRANPVWGIGRRKSSHARVRMFPGEGQFTVNGRPLSDYFNHEVDRRAASLPLTLLPEERSKVWDVHVNVNGGGTTGQSGAVRHGLSRALAKAEPALEAGLRSLDLMTRDARVSERKKYGRRGARRGFQFSKR